MSSIDSSTDSFGPENVLFAEERNPSRFDKKATYYEVRAGYSVDITYDPGTFSPTPHKYRPESPPFLNRDHALKQEIATRRAWYEAHPDITGYERDKLFSGKETDPKQLAYANYSAKPVYDFTTQMTPVGDLAERLGIQSPKEYREKHRALQFRSVWHHNGLPSYQFTEDGQVKTLHDTVTASNDRTAHKISMMRRVDSPHDGTSVTYTGRPDSKPKAIEQAEFIFRSEFRKPIEARQGIRQLRDGSYELTYVVNNLMSSMTVFDMSVTGIGAEFDETISIVREKEILESLGTLMIDGKIVHIKPIYFNQGVNLLNDFGIPSIQREINQEGYEELFHLAKRSPNPLIRTVVQHLKNTDELLPEEELFYRDLLCKLLGLPEVNHCKSSTDRTILAVAISMATKEWISLGLELPNPPHAILQDEDYKELFFSNVLSGHQVTRVSRSAEGTVAEAKQFSQIIGYEWGKNGLNKNYVALRMLPKRFTQESDDRPPQITVALKILKFVNKFFESNAIAKRIAYMKRAYVKLEFKPGLFLTKPKGMEMHYPKGSVNPHEREKKAPGILKKLKEGAARVGMTIYGFFATCATISNILYNERLEQEFLKSSEGTPLLIESPINH